MNGNDDPELDSMLEAICEAFEFEIAIAGLKACLRLVSDGHAEASQALREELDRLR